MLTKVNRVSASAMGAATTLAPLVILLFLIWCAGPAGFARLLYTYAARSNQLAAADAAVRLSPGDSEAHHIRGSILESSPDRTAAAAAYSTAVSLRPDDYFFWLSLARIRELNGDVPGAITAAAEAVQRAPYYSRPHWQLGNLLIRAGDQDRGFAELRLAVASNPALLPAVLDLAWQLSEGDAEDIKRLIQPNSSAAYIALAELFRKRKNVPEALNMTRAAGDDASDYRRRFLDELISAKQFHEAYSLWSLSQPNDSRTELIRNPGFEQESNLDEPGFGWRAQANQSVSLALDQAKPNEGKSALQIEFKGDLAPGLPVMTQLVMVEPRAHYQLQFAVRTEGIVSGALPLATIIDAVSGQPLGDSGAFPQTTGGWRPSIVAFAVPEATSTIQIVLQRNRCSSSPCPIFGHMWLDSFSLKKL